MSKTISRRTALKAGGLSIALPFLESMTSADAAESVEPPKRMLLICNALGLHSPSLFPTTPGNDYESTEYLKLLAEHRKDFTLFSGLSHPDQNGKEPHDTEMTWLSAARNPGLGGFKNSISVDQYAATKLGHVTRFPSLSLSTNSKESQSYTSNGVMLPAHNRPSVVFANMFLTGNAREQRRQRERLADGRSILDSVAEQSKTLQQQTGVNDRRQLDEYFEAIRVAEAELVEAEAWLDRPKPIVNLDPPQDITESADLIGRTRSMLNLIPLILRTDSSRVITVMIQDHMVVPNIGGISAEHHNLSHHGQDPNKISQLKIIETELLKCFSELLGQLSKPTEADGRLLDHTSVLLGSNLGNANAHDPSNLPIILAGGNHKHRGYIAHNQSKNTPLCNLYVQLLNSMGVETDNFGTSTGTLSL
jgi:hypothetical protein